MATEDKGLPLADTAATVVDVLAIPTGLPLGSIGKLALNWTTTFFNRMGSRDTESAFNTYVDQWATIRALSHNDAVEEVRKMLEGPPSEHDDTLNQMFRSMAFARSKASWQYVARMTAEYRNDGRAEDDFFRRTGRLLERCEAADISILVHLARETAGVFRAYNGNPGNVRWVFQPPLVVVFADERGGPDYSFECLALESSDGAFDITGVFDLLRESRLARHGDPGPGETAVVEFPVGETHLLRLVALFRI